MAFTTSYGMVVYDTSSPYAALERAEVMELESKELWIKEALKLFPIGSSVLITHSRGQYVGNVVRIEKRSNRIVVRNEVTLKETLVYPNMTVEFRGRVCPCVRTRETENLNHESH